MARLVAMLEEQFAGSGKLVAQLGELEGVRGNEKGAPNVIATVRDHCDDVQALCTRYGVRRLALFGSAARGDDFRPESSDIDFLVEFSPLPPGRRADSYFGLLADLERLFQRPVDLLDVAAIRNPYVEEAVHAGQELLYAATRCA